MTLRTHVAIVDDHAFVAESLARAIQERGLAIAHIVHPGDCQHVDVVRHLNPDLVLVDLTLADGTIFGLDLLTKLASLRLRAAVFTGSEDEALLGECLERGAVGIINKSAPFQRTLELIQAALNHETVNPEGDSYRWLLAALRERDDRKHRQAPFDQLTAREQAVLAALIDGKTPDEIAVDNFVSVVTIRSQIRTMFAKLGVHSQIAAVAKAREAGWTLPLSAA